MKKRNIIGIFILIILLIFMNNYFHIIDRSVGKANRNNEILPLNTSYEGISIFYDTLKKIGYAVKVDAENFIEKGESGIYVITENKSLNRFDLKDAESWIKGGGNLIYLTDRYDKYVYPDLLEKYKDSAYLYSLGKGRLLIGDIRLITNETLLKDKEGAYFILKCLDSLEGEICFNEYYRFSHGQNPSLYKNLSFPVKIILLQFLLFTIGCIVYLGKRFGKAKRIVDEIERDENEYLYASANLYEKSGCVDIIYKAFYEELQREIKKIYKGLRNADEWICLWEKDNLPYKEEAIQIFRYGKEIKDENRKDTFRMIKKMDKLIQMLVRRREEGWKRFKQKRL
ncbi:hypothetical protein FQB35_10255 [Crassaminicella thermophila]|uniref:DUF4350 domain-containing protein n=1 Tax=Crassaminicella thermophila TaxID=2599308 RepID=A0A5C0SEU3_CRATE|nr:hypothetical protein [Crassaminicella thermophila]QEK12680.1 hypothetical protein FQB35_10255 [Crassaminicella thermophila]